ncbi:spermidine synthase [Candidatus Dojkabacteria bacterium CG_4_10_14_3_um_filter_Dojkabacteria_WS6_41_9]|uniref:Spermidine synthase n=1 Tax=Candidatus Dojkabacteria bacterium CG_4_10_14_0_2_um_filter_Dojkabacteria_WS6_41_15 TaxID=2014249 RepID=A0A2M7W2R4_9BACT|nr:MAG: spermidine synthase [Candidatus Dojkabacteria bacterium CG_4_10_14_3_um_filter_Dojkabacteria_WS6_41_9]PJA13952.1 MAG: spermidine synthase [Candidatus Dojkabacteria bacterium CG_4_10_14_0_2_um_filter_Dojkabacteria_WS6_41_15]
MRRYLLEITVFVTSASLMIFELVGSRMLGPTFGTSLTVWTTLIGVILGSLSLGYYVGGKLADKQTEIKYLALIIGFATISLALVVFWKETILAVFSQEYVDTRIGALLASVILFFPSSVAFGAVSPYATKLKIVQAKEKVGATLGSMSAISTVGSIVGTFLAGFWLIPIFGTNLLLYCLAGVMGLMTLILAHESWKENKKTVIAILVVTSICCLFSAFQVSKSKIIDVDTAYNRILIFQQKDKTNGKQVLTMGINGENHSSMYLDNDELVNEYTKYYHLARYFFPDFTNTIMLGGAGYSFPKDFVKVYPIANMDVVEIDSNVTDLAMRYFRLRENPHINIIHQDARVFLNRTANKYDVLFGDAFASRFSLPYQLTTIEAVQKEYDVLSENGVAIINVISAIEGEKGQFFRAEYSTYVKVFPQVLAFPVQESTNGGVVQNTMLVALKKPITLPLSTADTEIATYLDHLWKIPISADMPVLTDDHSPVDLYIARALH